MMTPKRSMALIRIVKECDVQISRKGPWSKTVLKMPGPWRNRRTGRYSKNGPLGRVLASTFDDKNTYVYFPTVELKASLERILYNDPTITFSTTQGP